MKPEGGSLKFGRQTRINQRKKQIMSYAPTVAQRPFSLFEAIRNAFSIDPVEARRNKVYRKVRNELQSLSDRDLADIGLCRGQIEDIAAEAAARA